MTVYEAIEKRQSVRAFSDRKIPADTLERILVAGTQAPTARNEQAHRTIAVTDPEIIKQLGSTQAHIGTAPCVLVMYYDGDSRTMACGQSARVLDCSICLSYMVLAAVEEGIQGCWIGGVEIEPVKKLLGLPENSVIVALHTLGYPADDTPRREKKDPHTLYEVR